MQPVLHVDWKGFQLHSILITAIMRVFLGAINKGNELNHRVNSHAWVAYNLAVQCNSSH